MLKCLNKVKVNSMNDTNSLTTSQLRSILVDYIHNIFDQIEQNKQEGKTKRILSLELNIKYFHSLIFLPSTILQ